MAKPLDISVILRCTTQIESRLTSALAAQTLTASRWELLVPTAEIPSVSAALPGVKIVTIEDAPAQGSHLAGLRQAGGGLVVVLAGDTILAPDFLEQALDFAGQHPHLGAFGGNCELQFQTPVSPDLKPWLNYFGLVNVDQPLWSNHRSPNPATPQTGALCLRQSVVERHLQETASTTVEVSPEMARLSLIHTALDLGLGAAVFPSLRQTVLISPGQANVPGLLKKIEALHHAEILLVNLRDTAAPRGNPSRSQKLANWLQALGLNAMERRIRDVRQRAKQSALNSSAPSDA